MVDLCLEAGGLLFAKFQLQLNDLLLLPQPSNDRPELRKLVVRGFSFSFSWGCRRRVRSVTNLGGLGANRLKVVVKEGVLSDKVLATNGRSADRQRQGTRWLTEH